MNETHDDMEMLDEEIKAEQEFEEQFRKNVNDMKQNLNKIRNETNKRYF